MENSLIPLQSEVNRLSPLHQEIIKAQEKTKLKVYLPEQRHILAGKIYMIAKTKLGLNAYDKEQESLTIAALSDDLANLGTFTEDEVLIALKMGLNGEFLAKDQTQVFFNSSQFMIWMKSYLRHRQDAIGEANRHLKKSTQVEYQKPSDEELKLQAIKSANDYADSIAKAMAEKKEYKFPYGGLYILCKYLVKFELFKPVKEKMIAMKEQNAYKYPKFTEEDWERMVYADLYIEFVTNMAEMGVRFNKNGELV